MTATPRDPAHVVIAGGGVAAIEALLALRALAGHLTQVTLVSPEREFLYRPVTVGEPFERAQAHVYDLAAIIAEHEGDRFRWDSLAAVHPRTRSAETSSGERLRYDALVIAVGAYQREALPGALTFRGRADVPAMRALLDDLVAGRAHSLALTLASERTWSLPIYELALMTAAHLRDHGAGDARVTIVTPEEEPLGRFGPAAAEAIRPLLESRRIALRTSSLPVAVRGRVLVLAGGGTVFADRVVALPVLEGPYLPGLPHDRSGFLPVDAHGRVSGAAAVYAAGDVSAFPLKQGGLAAQQADAVAETIAASLGVAIEPTPFRPVLRGLLMTGGAPLYLRAEPGRLAPESTVAIEAARWRRAGAHASAAAGQPLWWPPAKVAGRYLAPYLATARPVPVAAAPLTDRVAVDGPDVSDEEYRDALELALLLADCDARWGDYRSALSALEAAEALAGALPPEYEAKRRAWQREQRLGD